jgi:hypothetical protein
MLDHVNIMQYYYKGIIMKLKVGKKIYHMNQLKMCRKFGRFDDLNTDFKSGKEVLLLDWLSKNNNTKLKSEYDVKSLFTHIKEILMYGFEDDEDIKMSDSGHTSSDRFILYKVIYADNVLQNNREYIEMIKIDLPEERSA